MILLSDPAVAAVAQGDNGEELVDVRGVLRVDGRAADAGGRHALMRSGLLERLVKAQAALPGGLELLVIEAYRDYDAQLAIFNGYRETLRGRYPEWPDARLHVETTKFVSPVEVAPHSTGGAVDLTLCDPDGRELDMGTVVDATPDDSDDACFTAARNISAEAVANRRVLGAALDSAGLVNYPTEWWHWSYGERYWALMTGAPATLYGPVRR
ncbi:D-alanyl-D-alanine dipeptidase [Catenuloplanes nepalensis]|uniref:D-alanyl-D-alanine dipeptidase n=1 Tax=Catenuloplanes nepalensis TaxID=587533 RepID=A0ABT9N1R6_9ACTN|nr:M15 family metallopeptidase [Catenuloplanes nepalensis]MDP9797629.1 D-alanyl-D-alanine dipeptidase [Catenuloplanes nepalensis]